MEETVTAQGNGTPVNEPEVAGDPPPEDPSVIGALTTGETQAIQGLRQQGMQVTLQIGNLEIQKSRLLGELTRLEGLADKLLKMAGKRCGVPDGVGFQVAADGKIRLAPNGPAEAQG